MTNSAILRIARTWFAAMALALPLACGGALAQETASASVKLVRVIRALPVGTPWLRLNVSRSFLDSCPYGGVTQIADERKELRLASFSGTFKVALQSAGYKVVTPGEDNLFDGEARSADLEVAAVITSVLVTGCVSEGDPLGERGGVKGGSLMSVDWQVYSPINKQVVAHLSTSASATLDQSITGGVDLLISRAFETNARRLASNPDFRAAMSAPKALTNSFVRPGQQGRIALAGSLKAAAQDRGRDRQRGDGHHWPGQWIGRSCFY